MYSTCIHCHAPLGANERIEHCHVGGRLAFDSARGRLWVVCPTCRHWNLTPIDERWEAVEECERIFRATPRRVSTDEIGLGEARGISLVRVGEPLRPEMAAWRYGAARRPVSDALPAATMMVPFYLAQLTLGSEALGGALPMICLGAGAVNAAQMIWFGSRMRVLLPDGTLSRALWRIRMSLVLDGGDGWALEGNATTRIRGPAATHSLRGLLAHSTRGISSRTVSEAVSVLSSAGDVRRFPRLLAEHAARTGERSIGMWPAEVRLALAMAIHEDEERAIAEGELAALAAEWKLAEDVATISDSLLSPALGKPQ